ncbi:DUF2471 family protein [Burkholderia vietnamiensis]|uniref:DUF2471 family protein n=1 Tax=Burkholderia vietnamiensis TaxID=60552 RepID=UPI001FC8B7BA|nr:DUF2471 family protein [Burkholderia vietnamiensis]
MPKTAKNRNLETVRIRVLPPVLLAPLRRPSPAPLRRPATPALLEIEEEAFSDLGFQSRNEAAVVAALPRIGPTTLPGVDLNALIDWDLSAEPLPVAYRCVRDHLRSMSSAAQRGGEV